VSVIFEFGCEKQGIYGLGNSIEEWPFFSRPIPMEVVGVPLVEGKCFSEVEEILKKYVVLNGPQSSLWMHLGQGQLKLNKRGDAAESFKASLRQGSASEDEFKFNDFALALAAYALHDRVQFDLHVAVGAAGSENLGNRQNMKFLAELQENFDRP
jgi:hypothetical protein